MPRVLIIDQRQAFVDLARRELDASDAVELCLAKETLKSSSREGSIDEPSFSDLCQRNAIDTLIFSPRCVGRFSTALDLRHARQVFEHGRAAEIQHVVLLSSAAVYCPHHGNPGMISETRPTSAARSNRVTQQWRLLELAAEECLAGAEESKLTILRPCPTLVPKARDYFNRMGRSDYVAFALRHGAPIIPFVNLGTAEIFPILAGFKWSWWKRNTEWPFFPITPTFPWLPIPLPTKWHLRILEPIAVDRLSSRDKADEPRVVEEIAEQVRGLILRNLLEMRSHRKSVFWGSLGNERQDSPKY